MKQNWKPQYISKNVLLKTNKQKQTLTKIILNKENLQKYYWVHFAFGIYCWASIYICFYTQWDYVWILFSFFSGCHLEIDSRLQMVPCVYFLGQYWNPAWVRPMQAPCMWPLSLWRHVGFSPIVSRTLCLLGVFYFQWHLLSSCLLFHRVSWAMN